MSKHVLQFKPRARLIRTIGDRLISGPEAAVIELIKNAHDADASFVCVIFKPPLSEGQGRILVEDDGHGMSFTDVEEKWMEPATTDKIDRRASPGGRILLGSKGIGRFAAARLGRYLALMTTAKRNEKPKKFETTFLSDIDWDEFDKHKYLSEIRFPVELEYSEESKTGTRLEIRSLRDTWTENSLRTLHQELRRLISPMEEVDNADFRIFLDFSACTEKTCGFDGPRIVNTSLPADTEQAEIHRVQPYPVLKACDYAVEGAFLDEPNKKGKDGHIGRFEGSMTIHRGALKPEPILLDFPLRADIHEAPIGTVLIDLFIFDREASAIKSTMKRAGMGDLTANKAREILDGMSGIAIYRDKFRIRPYGDSDKDWLTLDTRRVQAPTLRIGYNQVSGIIVIGSEEHSGLIERSSREGLEENASFRRLQRLVLDLLALAVEPRRLKFREDAEIGRSEPDTFRQAYNIAELDWTTQIIEKLPKKERSLATARIAKEATKLKKYLMKLEEKQSMLASKVTLGLIIGEVLQEGRPPVAFIQHEASRLTKWWHTLFDKNEESAEHQKEVPKILRGMGINAEKLRSLFSALEPLSGTRRGKPRLYNPSQIILDTLYVMDSKIKALGVDVVHRNYFEDDLLGYPTDLSTAATNIIDNALYWFEYQQTKNPTLSIELRKENNLCVTDITDNGPGIPREFRDRVFDIGFTLKPFGTGLGLNIALEALSRSDGSISLIDVTAGAGFELSLPIRRNQR